MIPLDFLYYSLAIGFLILVGFLSYTLISLSQTLKRLTSILVKVDDITKDVENFKEFIKNGAIYLKNMLVKKGGEKNGK
jgi:uncharacterized protein YoxC